MEYKNLIEKLISGFDLKSEIDRRRAYLKCIEYANENFDFSPDYNPFIAAAANVLGQKPVVVDFLKKTVEETGDEKIYLTFIEDTGPEMTCNRTGFIYLSKLLYQMSQAKAGGEHIHLSYGEPPLCGDSFPINIYFENEEWFEKNVETDNNDDGAEETEVRDINPEEIVAFLIINDVPPPLLMSKAKIYRVLSVDKYGEQKVWNKSIREDKERMFIFTFKRDDGEEQELALDLDDDSVIFFTRAELEQIKEV